MSGIEEQLRAKDHEINQHFKIQKQVKAESK